MYIRPSKYYFYLVFAARNNSSIRAATSMEGRAIHLSLNTLIVKNRNRNVRLNCCNATRAQFAIAVTRLALESLQLCSDITFARFAVMILSRRREPSSLPPLRSEEAAWYEMCHVKCGSHKGHGTFALNTYFPWNFLRNLIRRCTRPLWAIRVLNRLSFYNLRPKVWHFNIIPARITLLFHLAF